MKLKRADFSAPFLYSLPLLFGSYMGLWCSRPGALSHNCGANLRRATDALVLMMQGRGVDATISTDELYN